MPQGNRDRQEENTTHKRSQTDKSGVVNRTTGIGAEGAQRAILDPSQLSPAEVLQLQRTIGNQAVARMLATKGTAPPLSTKKEIQKKGTHESKDVGGIEKINTGNSNEPTIQRRFGFEIEVPIFLTEAHGPLNARRRDPGTALALNQGSFDIKVDHNQELQPLASYANQNQNGNTEGFGHGPPIVEMVTHPMDEFALTEQDVRDRAENMAAWAENVHGVAAAGEHNLTGNLHVGSASPRRTLQSTMGYFQTTYGVKLSSVPEMLKHTAKKGKKNAPAEKRAPSLQLEKAVKAGYKATHAIKHLRPNDPGPKVKGLTTQQERKMLEGYTVLLANYILADTLLGAGVGLGKNLLGDYFYKTNLGTLRAALPADIQTHVLDEPAILAVYIQQLAEACDRDPADDMAAGMTITQWVTQVVGGGDDVYLNAMKNPWSAVLNSENMGPGTNPEAGVVMENREPQNLDDSSKQKHADNKTELAGFHGGPQKTQAQLQDFLRDMTDPKKYPSDQWASMMVKVYHLLRQINA
ncbi:MAG: hypothetical protein H0T73_16355 [Ardenticatenales bacterium]|nr:hypothetical protein [Ardenticatenales bacterium]